VDDHVGEGTQASADDEGKKKCERIAPAKEIPHFLPGRGDHADGEALLSNQTG